MAITRVLYIVYPAKAATCFTSKSSCFLLSSIPFCIALCYGIPTLFPCCHRLYTFSTYAFCYVGPGANIQMMFSLVGTGIGISALLICYPWVVVVLWKQRKVVAGRKNSEARKNSAVSLRYSDRESRKCQGYGSNASENIEIKVSQSTGIDCNW